MELAYSRWPAQFSESARTKLVFLHGMGGTGALWRPIAAVLEDEFDVLAPDQRGHGKSQLATAAGGRVEPAYTPLDYGRDLVESLGSLSFHPAFVIGHSMGVRSACALAHLKSEWVKGLVLIDLGFSGPAGGGLGENLATFIQKLPQGFPNRAAARNFMDRECPDPSITQYLMAVSVTDPSTNEVSFPFDHGALVQTIHAARDVSVRGWIKEAGIRGTPVLVLRGAESKVWSHEEFEAERAALKAYPSILFEEFAGTGHGLPYERRKDFVSRLKRFVLESS